MSNDDEDGVVIPWPHPKAATSETTKPAGIDAIGQPGSARPSGIDDAFDEAVRRAIETRTDTAEPAAPQGADELVAQVYSALSGTDPASALAAVREQLAARESGPDAPVIDLQAAREARQKVAASEASQRLGASLKETFNDFIQALGAREGKRELVLDGQFFKQHGSSLLGNLFKGLATALTQGQAAPRPAPSERAPDDGGAHTEPAADAVSAPGEAKTERGQTEIRIDLGSLLSGLFQRRAPPQPAPDAKATPEADLKATPEADAKPDGDAPSD